MAVLPANLALANVADGASIVASDHRNNYSSIQAYTNALNAILSGGTSGQVLGSSGGTTIGWVAGTTSYRKTTAKTVNTTVAATDLLNAEITVAAGVMGTTGMVRLAAWGDWLQNSGGASVPPRLQLLFGGATLIDTSTLSAASVAVSATRGAWRVTAEILNTAAAVQVVSLTFEVMAPGGYTQSNASFTTGSGAYTSYATNSTLAKAVGITTGTVNTTVAAALVLNVINGSASASYETKLLGALVEIV